VAESREQLTVMGSFDAASRPAGARRARAIRAARGAALAALGVGGAVLVGAWLWPLPEPDAADALKPGPSPAMPEGGETIESRRDRLAALSAHGNVFAPDREAWALADAGETEGEPEGSAPEEETTDPGPTQAASGQPDGAPAEIPVEEIALTERPTAAASKSLDALALRGVLETDAGRLAMIQGGEAGARKDTLVYREGDVFYGETWRVVRVDARHDRVILEHLSHGDVLALGMYGDEVAAISAAAPDQTTEQAAPEVASRTALQARDDLRKGGVPEEDVNELFDLVRAMERGETPEVEEDPAAAQGPEGTSADDRTEGLPPAMAQLLRSMLKDAAGSSGSGEGAADDAQGDGAEDDGGG